MTTLVVIPGDPLWKYVDKGEVKERYWNPGNMFDEVHIISLNATDVDAAKASAFTGSAKVSVHCVGRPTPWSLWLYFSRVARVIRELAPALIRAHGPWHAGSVGAYAGRRLGIPCAVSIHNEYDEMRRWDRSLIRRLVRPLEEYTMRRASVVICVSNYLRRFARRHGCDTAITIYNRVYGSQFARTDGPRASGQQPTILSVMRLDQQKCPECLIRSMAHVNARLRIIGQGEKEAMLRELSRELAVEDRVEFIRMVPNREIHRYYHEADIFALATHYEGFCIPILEAMASGLPVVASVTQPIPELVGDAGVVVDNSPEQFAVVLNELLEDRGRLADMSRKSMARARCLDGSIMEAREQSLFEALTGGSTEDVRSLCTDFEP